MVRGLATYVRQHHLALLALFVALGGTSVAATNAFVPANSVGTKQLKNGAVTKTKIAKKTLGALGAKGPAGGDLAGSYPNPTIAAGAIRASRLGPIMTVEHTSGSIGPSSSGSTSSTCPAGSVLISGGGFTSAQGAFLTVTRAESNAWRADAWNTTALGATVTAYAYCLAS